MLHADADSIHKGAYVQATDPALDATLSVAAFKMWVDTSTGPPYQMKVRNAANTGWDLIGTVSATAPDYPAKVNSYLPEFYYRLNEASGNPVDGSAHATPAVLNGSGFTQAVAGLLTGSTNKALQVAGAADVSVATLARLQPATFTLICLFKPTASAARNPLITSNHTDYWSQGRGLSLETDATGKLHANFSQGAAPFTHSVGTTILQAGTIYHCAVTFNGDTVDIFLNGVLEASAYFPYSVSWVNQTDWRLGSNQQTGSGGSAIYASGVIDEAALIATALNAKQIEELAGLALGFTPDHASDIDDEYIDGLELTYVDSITIQVSRGACHIPGAHQIIRRHAPIKLAPALAASTFYYVYAYVSAGQMAIEASTTVPAFYGTNGAIKSGDPSRRFLGAFLTNASSAIYNFDGRAHGHEYEVRWRELNSAAPFLVLSAANPGNGTTATQSLSAIVPDIVFKKFRFLAYPGIGSGDVINVGIGSVVPVSGAWYATDYSMRVDMRNGSASATGHAQTGEIFLTVRSFDYVIGYVSSGSLTLHAKGFTVRR